MKFFLFVISSLLVSMIPAFGASHPEYSGIEDPLEYRFGNR